MKKVVGIFMAMVMVFMIFSVALGDMTEEVYDFCNENESLKYYAESIAHYDYYIVGDCAYAVSNFGGDNYDGIYELFMAYESYLKENYPELERDVEIDITYVGSTENYEMICVWLKLNNGKTFKDYLESEPEVSELSGIFTCKK